MTRLTATIHRLPQASKNGKTMPTRPKNNEVREREYLHPHEVEALIKAAGSVGRHGHRDRTLLLVMYTHGLRVGELVALRWSQVDFTSGVVHVNRLKQGKPSVQPMRGEEKRALRRLQRENLGELQFVFSTERGGPLTVSAVQKIVKRAGEVAGLPMPTHPHMLRHSAGFKFASDGQDTRAIQDYLGHKNIQHTVRYTELAPGRFRSFWKD